MIYEIQKEISNLFDKYKIPVITKNIKIEDLHRWSFKVSTRFNLDVDEFPIVVTELSWSIAHVQLSLGYSLIARQDCKFSKEINTKIFREENMPNAIGIPEIHFWYHIYNSYECIYRCWERIAAVIKSVCYLKSNEKLYFDQIVNKLINDDNYNRNPFLNDLKKQIKHWNEAAKNRNEISHGSSSPFRNMIIKGEFSNILGINGFPITYLNYSITSPKKSIEQVVDRYKKIFPAMKVMVDFIDNINR